MRTRFNKLHPVLKHAGYSATTLLPGEDAAGFEKLRRGVIAEFAPVGALEENIVNDMACLIWRKKNLPTFRIAKLAEERRKEIITKKLPPPPTLWESSDADETEAKFREATLEANRAGKVQARQELGDIYELIDIGEPATIEGLMKELDIKERLDGLINKCLKQLLAVRGVKSVSAAPSSVSTPQISGPRKAG